MSQIRSAAIFLVAILGLLSANGYPNGAPLCPEGIPALEAPQSQHLININVTSGALADLGWTLFLDGVPLVPNTPYNVTMLQSHTLLVTGPTHRGGLIRLGGGTLGIVTAGALSPLPGQTANATLQISAPCLYAHFAGVTHFINVKRNYTIAALYLSQNYTGATNLALDVTIVGKMDINRDSSWAYSGYILNAVEPPPGSPTLAPPTSQPTSPPVTHPPTVPPNNNPPSVPPSTTPIAPSAPPSTTPIAPAPTIGSAVPVLSGGKRTKKEPKKLQPIGI
jgi:hypothetical protein